VIVVTLTDCPPRLRGDLSKWLMEINTGVYVGNLSARVRDELWERICSNLKTGRATMVFSAAGEQHLDFRVHNTTWEPVEFDGIKLMRRPLPNSKIHESTALSRGFSHAAQFRNVQKVQRTKGGLLKDYTVFDIETTGLNPEEDRILELGALRVRSGRACDEFNMVIKNETALPQEVKQLTGITEEICCQGVALETALKAFLEFIGSDILICYHARFDCAFIRQACIACGLSMFANRCVDTLPLARRKLRALSSHRLTEVAAHFDLSTEFAHRALPDCRLTHEVYMKLNEL
jgi:CRISPR-associated protein Cas2